MTSHSFRDPSAVRTNAPSSYHQEPYSAHLTSLSRLAQATSCLRSSPLDRPARAKSSLTPIIRVVVPEAPLEQTDTGRVPHGEGWFVLNAREARWLHHEGRGRACNRGELSFPQLGISLFVLEPGEPIGQYHWDADQEDFLVLSGEALLLVEGRSGRCAGGTSSTAPPGRSTSSSAPARRRAPSLAVGAREHKGEQRLGRLYGRPARAPARRRSRTSDDRRERGVRRPPRARADRIPRGLAPAADRDALDARFERASSPRLTTIGPMASTGDAADHLPAEPVPRRCRARAAELGTDPSWG